MSSGKLWNRVFYGCGKEENGKVEEDLEPKEGSTVEGNLGGSEEEKKQAQTFLGSCKRVMDTCFVSFSMFSAWKVPFVSWDEKNTRFMLLAFPLVGAVCGFGFCLLSDYLGRFGFSPLFSAICLTFFPVVFTGGIHLDGYCDTLDGLSSHQSRKRQLEILSDPHVGVFAVMGLVAYLGLFCGILYELEMESSYYLYFMGIFVISRCVSGICLVSLPSAKSEGLAVTFSAQSDGRLVLRGLWLVLGLCFGLFFAQGLLSGLCLMGASLLVLYRWQKRVYTFYQGVTGDLLGYLSQTMEFYLFLTLLFLQKGGIL